MPSILIQDPAKAGEAVEKLKDSIILSIFPVSGYDVDCRERLLGCAIHGDKESGEESSFFFYWGRTPTMKKRKKFRGLERIRKSLKPLFEDQTKHWVCYDKRILMTQLINEALILKPGLCFDDDSEHGQVDDVRSQVHLIEGGYNTGDQLNLGHVVRRWIKVNHPHVKAYREQLSDRTTTENTRDKPRNDLVDPEVISLYACTRARQILQIHCAAYPLLSEKSDNGRTLMECYQHELDLGWNLAYTQHRGLSVDVEQCRRVLMKCWNYPGDGGLEGQVQRWREEADSALRKFWGSSKNCDVEMKGHVARIMFDVLGLPELSGTTHNGYLNSLHKTTLEPYLKFMLRQGPALGAALKQDRKRSARELAGGARFINAAMNISEIARHRKRVRKVLEVVDRRGAIHPEIDQLGARSFRMTTHSDSIQNIEKDPRIRSIYRVRPGMVSMRFDFSQVQFRIAAHYSREPDLVAGYNEGRDFDAHTDTTKALRALGLDVGRNVGKACNFSVIFGIGYRALAQMLGLEEVEAKNILARFREARPLLTGMKRHVESSLTRRQKDGRSFLEDLYGRRICLDQKAFYKGFVMLVQECEASMFKRSLCSVYQVVREFNRETGGDNAFVLYTIHDELEVECKRDQDFFTLKQRIQDVMEAEGKRFRVPFVVDVSYSTKSLADANFGCEGKERVWTSDEEVASHVKG